MVAKLQTWKLAARLRYADLYGKDTNLVKGCVHVSCVCNVSFLTINMYCQNTEDAKLISVLAVYI